MNELQTRILSAIVLVAVVAGVAWWSADSFAMLCAFGFFLLLKEWRGLILGKPRYIDWFMFGVVYLGAGAASLAYLRYANINILAATIAIVAVGDSAAYLVGRKIGKHKIAPSISPGKSWEGLAASVMASAVTGAYLGHIAPIPHAIIGAALAFIGLGGDLFESWLKRRAGAKDSGTLIPGHGGLFDRVDALLPCAIFAAIALYTRTYLQ